MTELDICTLDKTMHNHKYKSDEMMAKETRIIILINWTSIMYALPKW